MMDVACIYAQTKRRVWFMAKKELFENKLLAKLFEAIGAFPINRGEADIAGIRTAIVTSSHNVKMANAYRAHPELPGLVGAILTSNDFTRSKPDPECFLKGMEVLGGTPEETIVFEDSLHGINAGRAAGAKVIGLTTTNKSEVLTPLCDMVIDDFVGFSLKDIESL